jgi:formylglycine-generating enzyme required for sulfatase activity
LHQQGRDRVDNLVQGMLDRLGPKASLAEQARCAGLLGAMLRDLTPVDYRPRGAQYGELLHRVSAIFDALRAESVPIETRIEAADALGQAGDARLDHHRDDYWVSIPAGKFLMARQKTNPMNPNFDVQAYDVDSLAHELSLSGFRIARYPLTVSQFEQFVDDDGYRDERWWEAAAFGDFSVPANWEEQLEHPSRPVVGVSWYESAAFCGWAGYRLPTEAEWERAAMGTGGRRYPWGGEPAEPSRLNYAESGIGYPTPVGVYPYGATPDGIFDLAGNVWEWCAGWYREQGNAIIMHTRELKEHSHRVIRGGSWSRKARFCVSASRDYDDPSYRGGSVGFRMAGNP